MHVAEELPDGRTAGRWPEVEGIVGDEAQQPDQDRVVSVPRVEQRFEEGAVAGHRCLPGAAGVGRFSVLAAWNRSA